MTRDQVARRLGISKTLVRLEEQRALAKIRIALGIDDVPMPRWVQHVFDRQGMDPLYRKRTT